MAILGRGILGQAFATGSILVGLGGETTTLPVGTEGQVLTVVITEDSQPYLAYTNASGVNKFNQLSDAPATYVAEGVIVGNSAGNGLVFTAAPSISNSFLRWNGSAFDWATTASATTFTSLTDGPGTINSNALVIGNSAGSRLAFTSAPTTSNTFLSWNGTSFVWVSGTGGVSTFAALSDGPGQILAKSIVVGNTAGNALTFVTSPTTSNTFLSWNGTSFVWAASAGSTTFVGLTDAPSTITTNAIVLGNAAGNALVFSPSVSGSSSVLRWNGTGFVWSAFSLTQLSDGPSSLVANGVLAVNSAGTGTAFITAPTTTGTVLTWTGTAFAWEAASSPSSDAAFSETVGQVNVTFSIAGIQSVTAITAGWVATQVSGTEISVVHGFGKDPVMVQWIGQSGTFGRIVKAQPQEQNLYVQSGWTGNQFNINQISGSDINTDPGLTATALIYFSGQ